ncbi:unnamed protein product [Cylicostephanus goldi]|uniref:Uncharacterized protein n=1 Tax=Cylicostephanus goldi TaxID=71465 RepID=A0A3P6R5L3_CYLGO|nr:unnamed protein product [Cylicostephanus goldi]
MVDLKLGHLLRAAQTRPGPHGSCTILHAVPMGHCICEHDTGGGGGRGGPMCVR